MCQSYGALGKKNLGIVGQKNLHIMLRLYKVRLKIFENFIGNFGSFFKPNLAYENMGQNIG